MLNHQRAQQFTALHMAWRELLDLHQADRRVARCLIERPHDMLDGKSLVDYIFAEGSVLERLREALAALRIPQSR